VWPRNAKSILLSTEARNLLGLEGSVATPVDGYAACCAAIRDMDLDIAMQGIRTPTLVIVGDRDPATPPSHGEKIAEAIAGSSLVRLSSSHLSNIEAANDFNTAVMTHLAG